MIFQVPSNPNHSMILWFCDLSAYFSSEDPWHEYLTAYVFPTWLSDPYNSTSFWRPGPASLLMCLEEMCGQYFLKKGDYNVVPDFSLTFGI